MNTKGLDELLDEATAFLQSTNAFANVGHGALDRGFAQLGLFRFDTILTNGTREPVFVIVGDCSPVFGSGRGLQSGMEALAGYYVDMESWLKAPVQGGKTTPSFTMYVRGSFANIVHSEANRCRVEARLSFFRRFLLRKDMHETPAWRESQGHLEKEWSEEFSHDPWPSVGRIRTLLIPEELLFESGVPDLAEITDLLARGRNFLGKQVWVRDVSKAFFYRGFAHFAVFLYDVVSASGEASRLWVMVGECPPYFVTDDGQMSGTEAISIYTSWLEQWIAALSRGSAQPSFPLLTAGGAAQVSNPKSLEPSLRILRDFLLTKVLQRYLELDQQGTPANREYE